MGLSHPRNMQPAVKDEPQDASGGCRRRRRLHWVGGKPTGCSCSEEWSEALWANGEGQLPWASVADQECRLRQVIHFRLFGTSRSRQRGAWAPASDGPGGLHGALNRSSGQPTAKPAAGPCSPTPLPSVPSHRSPGAWPLWGIGHGKVPRALPVCRTSWWVERMSSHHDERRFPVNDALKIGTDHSMRDYLWPLSRPLIPAR